MILNVCVCCIYASILRSTHSDMLTQLSIFDKYEWASNNEPFIIHNFVMCVIERKNLIYSPSVLYPLYMPTVTSRGRLV